MKQASDNYWNTFTPASRQNLTDQASAPTVIPVKVAYKEKTISTSSTTTKTETKAAGDKNFSLPKKPSVKPDSQAGSGAANTDSKPKPGGLKLNLKLGKK